MVHSEPVNLMVSFFLTVGIILPFAYTSYKAKIKNPLASNFQEFTELHHLHPTMIEKWKNHQLAFDADQNKLLYFRQGNYPQQSVINLKEVKNISIQEYTHTSGTGKYKHDVMDYLGVKLQFIDESHPPKMLEIYDGKLFPSISSERSIAKKWLEILQKQIKMNQPD